jgi:hypothetical protein
VRVSKQPDRQAMRERLTKLFEFLKAYTDLRYPPVREINSQLRTLWLKELGMCLAGLNPHRQFVSWIDIGMIYPGRCPGLLSFGLSAL